MTATQNTPIVIPKIDVRRLEITLIVGNTGDGKASPGLAGWARRVIARSG